MKFKELGEAVMETVKDVGELLLFVSPVIMFASVLYGIGTNGATIPEDLTQPSASVLEVGDLKPMRTPESISDVYRNADDLVSALYR
ncbi:hypothetical protein ACFL2V_18815 [Pseudomonadota bacterium]